MNLLSLPTELLLEIAKHLENQAWLNAFARTHQHTFSIINRYLHRYNADYQKHTALAFGVCRGLENVIRRSLAANPGDVNAKIGSIIPTSDEACHTPVCYAVKHGQTRDLELLLDEYGADIEQHCCRSITPLNRAAGLRKLELTKALIERGANIHAGEGRGPRPPLQAALSGDVDVCSVSSKRALMSIRQHLLGTQVKHGPAIILWRCAETLEGVKLLVELGLDLDAVTVRGMTPVKIVVEWNHFAIGSFLLECGAGVPEDQDFFVSCATRGYLEGLKLALDKLVSIDDEDSNGYTALSEATARGDVEAVLSPPDTTTAKFWKCFWITLINLTTTGTKSHENALPVAMRNKNWDCAKELLSKGAETNFNIDDELPLSYAARLGEEEIASLLLEKGAGADDDPTLLFWVVMNLRSEMLRQLLERGIDPNAYSAAFQQGHPSIQKHSGKGWLLPPLACAMSQGF